MSGDIMMKARHSALIIRLALDPAQDEYWWLPQGAAGHPLSPTQARELSRATPAVVLLDAAGIRLEPVSLPPGVKVGEAALLLEDQLCQPLDDVEVLPVQRQGRDLLLAVIDRQLAAAWQQRLVDAGIRVARWIPEVLAFRQAWDSEQPLLLQGDAQRWLFLPQHWTLLPLEPELTLPDYLNLQDEANPWVERHLADLPQRALVPWLAAHLPVRINLWRQSALQRLRLPPALQLTRRRALLLLPWVLVLLAGLVQLAVRPSGHAPVRQDLQQAFEQVMGPGQSLRQAQQQVQQRLDRLMVQRQWQQQRLDAWQPLQQQLQAFPAIRLQQLAFLERGIRAELQGVTEASQTALRQVPGRWTFTEDRAVWEQDL